jgi:hypothetical protein
MRMRTILIAVALCIAGVAFADDGPRPAAGTQDFLWALGKWECAGQYETTPITVAHPVAARTNIRAALGGEWVELDYRETEAAGFPLVSVRDFVRTGPAGGERSFVDSNGGRHVGSFEVRDAATVEFTGEYLVAAPSFGVLRFPFTETLRRQNGDSRFTTDSRLNFASLGLPITLTFQTLTCDLAR